MFTKQSIFTTSRVQVTEVSCIRQALVIGHDEWTFCDNSDSEVIPAEPDPQPEPSMSAYPQPGTAPTLQSSPEAGEELQIWPRPAGFLDLLMTVKSSFSATTQQSRPRSSAIPSPGPESDAGLSGNIFALEEAMYDAPESVATTVCEILEDHTEGLLNGLEDI
ncbi:hypothetical protein AOLI_G00224010 [Acnodon oligacanthus]